MMGEYATRLHFGFLELQINSEAKDQFGLVTIVTLKLITIDGPRSRSRRPLADVSFE